MCRLSIQAFHFFKGQTIQTTGCLPRLLSIACSEIDFIQSLGARLGELAIVPVSVTFGLLLASVTQ